MTYVGRFAPSPTGSLHLGSLVAAVGSYVDARHHGGRWLLRIEDLDTPRVIPGCADTMCRVLERFDLKWDGPVEYQSRRLPLYEDALQRLRSRHLVYPCSCSRRELALLEDQSRYPGTCRERTHHEGATATRFRVDDRITIAFSDMFRGECQMDLAELGDFIVCRRDHIVAYQLAVVVDDAAQDITHVVRGADLLPATAWQIVLQNALGLKTPRYGHLPLVTEPDGSKLSKSRRSIGLNIAEAHKEMFLALQLLNHSPPSELKGSNCSTLLQWAVTNWQPERLQNFIAVHAPH